MSCGRPSLQEIYRKEDQESIKNKEDYAPNGKLD
jgi:hypothetical protein